jgi:uncharacterized protein (TIGR03435 family)
MRFTIAGAFILLLSGAAFGQTKLEFDAATVKSAAPPSGGSPVGRGGPGSSDPGRVTYNSLTLRTLLSIAYGVKDFQLSGPSWLAAERYDVTATIPEGTTKEQFGVMLQNLLLDRFGIKLHRDTKEFPLHELSVPKNGSKLKPSTADPKAHASDPPPGPAPTGKDGFPQLPPGRPAFRLILRPNGFHLIAMVQPMSRLVDLLSQRLNSPVVDKTGLTGTYDFTLDFAPAPDFFQRNELTPPPGFPAEDQWEAPNLLTAVQEQLGLKLEKKTGPLELIVIDYAEKTPADN